MASSDQGTETTKKANPTRPPPLALTTEAQIEVRIRAACALVAAEINLPTEDVANAIDAVAVYNFATSQSIEPVEVVREVCKCRALINAAVTEIAKAVNRDFVAVYNVCAQDWFSIYEASENSNTPLVKMMRDAYDLNVKRGVTVQLLVKAKAKGAIDLQLDRLKLYKRSVDGERARNQRQANSNTKRAEARDKKVNEKRNQSSTPAIGSGSGRDDDPYMDEY